MLSYILEVSLCWGAFYLLYWLLLSRETFFHFNRWYLVGTLLASLIIPAVEWELPAAQTEIATVYFQPITVGVETLEVTVTATAITSRIGVLDVLAWMYWTGMAFFMLRFLVGMSQIYRLYHRSEKRFRNGYEIVLSGKVHPPFSFFNSLFISKSVELDPDDRDAILRHELAHIRGGHSLDVLLLEILNAIFWCSPFIYLYRRSLRNVHEYIADAVVLRTTKKKQYGHLLIRQSQSGPAIAIANHFHSQLKKRILMMMRNQSKRRAMLKYLLVIPLTLLVMLVFSNAEAQASVQQEAEALHKSLGKNLYANIPMTGDNTPGNFAAKFSGENFTKLAVEDGKILFEIKDGVTLEFDTIPISLNNKASDDKTIHFEIYYPNGEVEKLIGKANDNKILEKLNPSDIEAIDVHRDNGQNLVKIWLKGSKQPSTAVISSDEAPIFAGCEGEQDPQKRLECSQRKMLEYIYKAILYPKEARENGIQGTVVVRFYIDERGFVSNASISHGIGGGCDEEVLRVVNAMPRWTPRYKKDKPINTFYTLPVNYKLEGDERSGSFLSESELLDTITTFDYKTYEEKVEVWDWNKNKITVVGYGNAKKTEKSTPSTNMEELFKVVEEMPRFPGCEDAFDNEADRKKCADRKMLEFVYQNIRYPKSVRENGIQGTVVVSFIIEKDGSVSNPKIVREIGGGCGEEAVRVANLMQEQKLRWVPGMQKGQPVRVEFNLPIRFKLDNSSEKVETNFPPPLLITKIPANTLKLQDFKASPNPTTDILNLSFKGERKPTMVTVFDLQGKVLQTLNLPNFDGTFNERLDLSKASKGTLIISIMQGDKVYTEKVIVQ